MCDILGNNIIYQQTNVVALCRRHQHNNVLRLRVTTRASYQIRTHVGCACAGNAGKVSQRSRHEPRHVCDARAVVHVEIAYLRWRGKRSGICGACVTAILRIWQEAHRGSPKDHSKYWIHYCFTHCLERYNPWHFVHIGKNSGSIYIYMVVLCQGHLNAHNKQSSCKSSTFLLRAFVLCVFYRNKIFIFNSP